MIDPDNTTTMFAGTTDAGLFKSVDSGTTWREIGSGLPESGINAVVISDAILFATAGGGVFKSTDGGADWTQVDNDSINFANVLIADPTTSTTLYAGSLIEGVLKSTDGGQNWTVSNNGITDWGILSLVMDPSDPKTLYAGTANGNVFKSVDAAASWAETGLTANQVLALAVNPLTSTIVYAGDTQGLFKTTEGGSSWTKILDDAYVGHIVIDPTNSNTLYVSENNSVGVMKSTDGGATWEALSDGLPTGLVFSLAISPDATKLYAGTQTRGVYEIRLGPSDIPYTIYLPIISK